MTAPEVSKTIDARKVLEIVEREMGIGFVLISPEFTILHASKVLRETFGNLEGRDCFVAFNQRSEICPGCGVREVFENGTERVVHEQSGWDGRGNLVWSEIVAVPVRDERGEIVAALEVVIPITKRKDLEFRQAKWEQVISESPDLIAVIDRNFVHQAVNPAYAAAFARGEAELIGLSLKDLVGEDVFKEKLKEKFDLAFGGDVVALDAWFDLPANGRRFMHVTSFPRVDVEGRILGATVSARDITTLKDAEDEARRAQDHLKALLDNTDDYIMIADSRGVPELFNRAYARIMKDALGIEMKPGIQPHKHLEDENARAAWDALHERVLRGERFRVEYVHDFGMGRTDYLEVFFQPIMKDGQVEGFCELTRDITERRKAEDELRRSEEKYRSIIEHCPMGVVVYRLEKDGRLILAHVNAAAERILGIERAVLLERTIEEAFPSLAGTDIPETFRRVCREGIPWRGDPSQCPELGYERACEVSASRIAEEQVAVFFQELPGGVQGSPSG